MVALRDSTRRGWLLSLVFLMPSAMSYGPIIRCYPSPALPRIQAPIFVRVSPVWMYVNMLVSYSPFLKELSSPPTVRAWFMFSTRRAPDLLSNRLPSQLLTPPEQEMPSAPGCSMDYCAALIYRIVYAGL